MEEVKNRVLQDYRSHQYKKFIFGIASLIILAFLVIIAISVGSTTIPPREVLAVLLGAETSGPVRVIIWNIRIPQVIAAIVAGAGLSVSGTIMQTILKNPLGSPFTLGVSQAAGFGAAFSIVILGVGQVHSGTDGDIILNNPYITTISAFGWALVSTLIILALVRYKGAAAETLILTGVALGSLFGAGTTAIQYFADDVEVASIVFWTFGDVGRATWSDLGLIIAVLLPCLIYFVSKGWDYNVMSSGDESAEALGVDVERLRIIGMLLSSFLAAVIVSFVGIIGFVGLVAPHMVRKLIGTDDRYLIPFSALAGSILLLASDTAARTLLSPIVLPVGVVTSFLGAPLFIYLVMRGKEYLWS